MSFDNPVKVAIDSLREPSHPRSVSRHLAMKYLRKYSSVDYGDDVDAWIDWAKRKEHIDADYGQEVDLSEEARAEA